MSRSLVARLTALVIAGLLGAALMAGCRGPTPPPAVLTQLDIGFAQDMSSHHQQAVTMSDMLARDAGADVRALAEQIRFTQLTEIGQMTGWLQLAGAPPSGQAPMAWMHHETGHRHGAAATGMPGMATPGELTRLQRSTGRDNEVLFLQLMIRHHQGGIDMAASAARSTTTEAVHRSAVVMVSEQSQEIQVMATLLAQRNGEPLRYP